MSDFDFKNISVYDDDKSNHEIMKEIIRNNNQEDAFFLLDAGDIVRKHERWVKKMPRVVPHYAVKCNPNLTVIRIIAALGGKFDCASKQEIQLVMKNGGSPDSIIYANPIKAPSHIRYAKEIGIARTMVDTEEEVLKMKKIYPEAKLVIRIAMDGSASECGITFSRKFGCTPNKAEDLINFVKNAGMSLSGFSFHLGSPCHDANAFARGIRFCYELIKISESLGFNDCRLIDIGGGISGIGDECLDKTATVVNEALESVDQSIEIIAEPGRYYVESAFLLAGCVQGKKLIEESDTVKRFYYINDGTYGSFIDELLDIRQNVPEPLYKKNCNKKYLSVIWGQTCDPYDCVIKGAEMNDYSIGDWMIWENMGAYSLSNSTHFNGYTPACVFPIIRKTALKKLSAEMRTIHPIHMNGNGYHKQNGHSS